MQIIKLDNIGSTNDYLLRLSSQNPEWEGVVMAHYQSAGKGMGTNKWESESGKNLLFSILLHPRWLPVNSQYLLSMAEAVAIKDVLSRYVSDITIKWPNDIYWRDKKISGTRIDTNICGGSISDMVIGTGINVNQRTFVSDAPNPVSLWQITNAEHDAETILRQIVDAFGNYCLQLREGDHSAVIRRYHQGLYRREGLFAYRDINGEFEAAISEVMPNGVLRLLRKDGSMSEYMFKEVEFILPDNNKTKRQ